MQGLFVSVASLIRDLPAGVPNIVERKSVLIISKRAREAVRTLPIEH